MKVVKSQAAFYQQARVEVGVLRLLNARSPGAPGDRHIVRLLDAFPHAGHLCLVFELLSLNLYELVKRNRFRGLSLALLRVLVSQVLAALAVLGAHGVVHCDVKPENILLKSLDAGDVKLIDYGSACFEARKPGGSVAGGSGGAAAYIQSRFYRAPEVLLGAPYGPPIDVWSLGCVAAELFLGLPIFPGASEYDQMARIVAGVGTPPARLIEAGVAGRRFFARRATGAGGGAVDGGGGGAGASTSTSASPDPPPTYTLRSGEEYEASGGRPATRGKQYFAHTRLDDIIAACPAGKRSGGGGSGGGGGEADPAASAASAAREAERRSAFLDFLTGVLAIDPATRWTPWQASHHPFVTGRRFNGAAGPFVPPPDPCMPTQCGAALPRPVPAAVDQLPPLSTTAGASDPDQLHAHAHAAALAALARFPPAPGTAATAAAAAAAAAVAAATAAAATAAAAAATAAAQPQLPVVGGLAAAGTLSAGSAPAGAALGAGRGSASGGATGSSAAAALTAHHHHLPARALSIPGMSHHQYAAVAGAAAAAAGGGGAWPGGTTPGGTPSASGPGSFVGSLAATPPAAWLAAASPAAAVGCGLGGPDAPIPVGSLEAMRAGWAAPRLAVFGGGMLPGPPLNPQAPWPGGGGAAMVGGGHPPHHHHHHHHPALSASLEAGLAMLGVPPPPSGMGLTPRTRPGAVWPAAAQPSPLGSQPSGGLPVGSPALPSTSGSGGGPDWDPFGDDMLEDGPADGGGGGHHQAHHQAHHAHAHLAAALSPEAAALVQAAASADAAIAAAAAAAAARQHGGHTATEKGG